MIIMPEYRPLRRRVHWRDKLPDGTRTHMHFKYRDVRAAVKFYLLYRNSPKDFQRDHPALYRKFIKEWKHNPVKPLPILFKDWL
ncbi:hypothetical protein DRN98_07610, partial [Methanosarcinales archaeon]